MVPFHQALDDRLLLHDLEGKGEVPTGLVTSELTIIARSSAMIAMATQRPGCRTGRALMAPGRSEVPLVTSSPVG
jgi:hypothetical protein